MSINFPTAFWKNQASNSTPTISETPINWDGGNIGGNIGDGVEDGVEDGVGLGHLNNLYYGSVNAAPKRRCHTYFASLNQLNKRKYTHFCSPALRVQHQPSLQQN